MSHPTGAVNISLTCSLYTVKCATIIGTSAAGIFAALATAEAVSTLAIGFFGVVAFICFAAGIASATAAFAQSSDTTFGYFSNIPKHFATALATIAHLAMQTVMQALCDRMANGIRGTQRLEVVHR